MNKKDIKKLYIIPTLMVILSSIGLFGIPTLQKKISNANNFKSRSEGLSKLKENQTKASKEKIIELLEIDLKADKGFWQASQGLVDLIQIVSLSVLFFASLNIAFVIKVTYKK